ncbi:YkvA family protein [Parvibaculum sp.]|uniref:YkvA family protein n=1 Tax=Parvibaculum sp. TaxID=2024848 RepID=UPI00391AE142
MTSSHGEMDTESVEKELSDPKNQLPAVMARNEETVREGFWKKMARVAGKVPFAEEAAAAWFCARDPETPTRVRATLLAALAYFVMPVDFIPDIVAAFGFTDDATVLMAALGLVSSYMKPRHRKAAREALGLPPPKKDED